jgi:hypothetical protein
VSSIDSMAALTSRAVAPCFSASLENLADVAFCLDAVLFKFGEALDGIEPAFQLARPTSREVKLRPQYQATRRRPPGFLFLALAAVKLSARWRDPPPPSKLFWPRNPIAVAHRSAAKLLRPIPGMVASSRSCAPCRSSRERKPLWTKAWATAVVSPRRSHALDASQYSSKDEALRLMEKQRSFQAEAVLPANYLTAERPMRDIA